MRTPGVLSCLCIARTNRGCRGFDSARRAAAARQRQPFTACQPALQREPSTKTGLSQRDEGDAVTSNLKHAGMHKKDRQTHTHTVIPSSFLHAVGQQLACSTVTHTDESTLLCPSTVLPPFCNGFFDFLLHSIQSASQESLFAPFMYKNTEKSCKKCKKLTNHLWTDDLLR